MTSTRPMMVHSYPAKIGDVVRVFIPGSWANGTHVVVETRPGDYGTTDIRIEYQSAVGMTSVWVEARNWRPIILFLNDLHRASVPGCILRGQTNESGHPWPGRSISESDGEIVP